MHKIIYIKKKKTEIRTNINQINTKTTHKFSTRQEKKIIALNSLQDLKTHYYLFDFKTDITQTHPLHSI